MKERLGKLQLAGKGTREQGREFLLATSQHSSAVSELLVYAALKLLVYEA